MRITAIRTPSRMRILRATATESLWLLGVLGLALVVVTYLAGTPGRGELMFLDGDSMIVPLFSRSILEGTATNWAMSAVFFVPEIVMFLGLSLTGWGIQEAQFLSAVLNFVGLYLVFRLAAVTVATEHKAALSATLGFTVVCLIALTEGEGGRDSLQLASLLAMTTYYAATVLGALLTVGITRLIIGDPSPRPALAVVLFAVAALSVFSNPIYLAWATAPLVIIMCVVCAGPAWGPSVVWAIAALSGGSALGYLLRVPLASWVIADPDNYLQPMRSWESFAYYWSLLLERLSNPAGVFAVALVVALTLLGAWLTVRSLHQGAIASAVVAAYSWFAPLAITVGFIALGTEAARYLQLWAFAPALALVVLVTDARLRNAAAPQRRRFTAAAGVSALLGGVLAVVALPAAVERATAVDLSLACAVDWVNESGAVGAGQFWSVRAVKAHVDDPAQLLQVDSRLSNYAWLADRADFVQPAVSFLIVDKESSAFTLPPGAEDLPSTTIDCGRFKVVDYSPASIIRP